RITFSVDNHLKATQRFSQRDKLTGSAGKDLSDVERLRQEALDLARTGNSLLVFVRQFVHTENGNDVTQLVIALQCFLDATSNGVVLFANNLGIQLTTGGVQRVNSRINTQSSNLTCQNDCRVQVQESGRR